MGSAEKSAEQSMIVDKFEKYLYEGDCINGVDGAETWGMIVLREEK